jgi:hypothetical protein
MSELPYQVLAWIKKDQEEREVHREKIVLKRMREDSEFVKYIKALAPKWKSLSVREKLLVQGIAEHRKLGRNLTDAQRSAIVALYLKHAS